jgi:DNA modification methylase
MEINELRKLEANSIKSESTAQQGINPGQPSSPPNPHAKLEDVFTLNSTEYPLEQHECNAFLPPMLPDQYRRLKEEIRKNGHKMPIVICGGNSASQIATTHTGDAAKNAKGVPAKHLARTNRTSSTYTASTGGQGEVRYIVAPRDQVLRGDALAVLRTLPPNSVDCCMTSPPYWALRDYGVEGQLGLETTPQEYIARLCDVFDEVKRVLKPTGTCWVNLGDCYSNSGKGGNQGMYAGEHPNYGIPTKVKSLPPKSLAQIPSRFGLEMADRGWILRNEIIWHKPNCMPSSVKDRFTVDFEKLFFFAKTTKYHFEQQLEPLAQSSKSRAKYGWNCDRANNQDGVHIDEDRYGSRFCNPRGRNKRCVWSITTKGFKGAHFATYPEQLCETPIKAGCPVDGIVLDPFAGTGTTLVVAKRLGRNYIGCELNPDYCRIIDQRLKGQEQRSDAAILGEVQAFVGPQSPTKGGPR